jgi:hypothetical protein
MKNILLHFYKDFALLGAEVGKRGKAGKRRTVNQHLSHVDR